MPDYTVSEISGAIKRTLEGAFGRVRVRGEITEFKRYPSGHLYFSLKDEGGKIASVVWRGSVSRLGLVPENGLEIIASGRISAYGERSSYQLVIDRMEYAGEGALLARIERLRLRLAEEGLFDAARKRAIPFLPRLIGVVTSAQGAVLHDIRTTVSRRFPRSLLIWPVAVQGEGAAAQIAVAIAGFDALRPGGAVPRPDVLIVARGGGSLEDLMAFNDESVLRAAAACRIPLISAVGHETDTTLIDFVSDRRAPTPTAAAEMAVPMRAELLADLAHRAARLDNGLGRVMQGLRMRLERAGGRLPDLPRLLDTARMRLDDRAHRLDRALPGLVQRRRADLIAVERRMPTPSGPIALRRARLAMLGSELASGLRQALRDRTARLERQRVRPAPLLGLLRVQRARLDGLAGRLEAMSPLGVLERGYVLVRDADGRPVTRAEGARPGAQVTLTFRDGERAARIERPRTGAQGTLDI
ncbi:exodeoxyribonuclease VII large subunit [Ameyamaea chiangmaiensis NBRC 103196]|nr:exodeoxyribonuclease VII large subunit [Ameyamaea chiangmaiensis NBRC 103196]